MNPGLLKYDFVPPDLPAPWAKTGWFQVGGLIHVGFGPGQDLLLVESPNGSSVIDVVNGKKIARDESFVSTRQQRRSLQMPGFNVLTGQMISMAGFCGGGLRRTTGDDFRLFLQAPYWPDERIVLHLPDKRGNPPRYHQALVVAEPASTIHAYGFFKLHPLQIVLCSPALRWTNVAEQRALMFRKPQRSKCLTSAEKAAA